MFHGFWWLIARPFSPFDAAFLPANDAVVDALHLQPPSPLPAAMDPRQAAAEILDAQYAVPMHYERNSRTRARATSRFLPRRTSSARTPDDVHTCCPSENGWI